MDPNLSQERNLPDAKKYGAIEYRLTFVQNAVEQSANASGGENGPESGRLDTPAADAAAVRVRRAI